MLERGRSWSEAGTDRHVVQVYRERSFMVNAVTAWIGRALADGGGGLLVCRPTSAVAVLARLAASGVDVAGAQGQGRLRVLDAEPFMARFIVDGRIDGPTFTALVGDAVRTVRAAGASDVRAWGEMVDLLHQRGDGHGAARLEGLWNEVIEAQRIRLLCSYEVDNLDPSTHGGLLGRLCAGHSALVPEEDPAAFDLALGRALVEVLGEAEAASVRSRLANTRPLPIAMPPSQAVLVSLTRDRPELATRVLDAMRAHLRPAGT